MSLKVNTLCVSRGGLPVLADVSFTLEPGRALVLKGPNGAGKTTLLRTIAGLQPHDSGTIEGGGETLVYAGHSDGVKPSLSVTENLTFWAHVFGAPGIAPAIEAFQLGALATRAAGTLSAGQKRRVSLARLLLTGRDIWALDEPTVSLDAASRALFADVVQSHLSRGGSALIATHVDLGVPADVLDLTAHRARPLRGAQNEVWL